MNPIRNDEETGLSTGLRLAELGERRVGHGAVSWSPDPTIRRASSLRRGALIAVAAFVVVLAGVGVVRAVLTADGSVDGAGVPTLTISLSEASGDAAAVAAFRAVEDAFRLYNSGDAAGWADVRDRGSYYESEGMRGQILLRLTEETRSQMAANTRYETIACVSQGFGEWPDMTDEGVPVAVGHYFTCDAELLSDSPRLAGAESFNWVVSDGEVVAVNSSFTP